eukprot:s670_g8.t1
MGKTGNRWNTSPSASYPAGMCKFIADTIFSAVASGRGPRNAQCSSSVNAADSHADGLSSVGRKGEVEGDVCSVDAHNGSSSSKVSKLGPPSCSEQVTNGNAGVDAQADFSGDAVQVDSSSDEGQLQNVVQCSESTESFDLHACLNRGHPMKVEWDGRSKDFTDGFGLCSPTRWYPTARGLRRSDEMKKLALDTYNLLMATVRECIPDFRGAAFKFVTGKFESSPFSAEALMELRGRWASFLPDFTDALVVDDGQPFLLRGLAQWLRVFHDPDVDSLVDVEDSFASGVPLGVDSPLPRTPQVYPEKVKHRKLDESDFNPVADNYQSAQWSSAELEKKFREEEALVRMFPSRLTVLKGEFGDRFRVASMAAIVKPDGTVRPLPGGTHSVRVKNSIVYRDQIQCPGPAEVAAVVRESVESRGAPFCVSADIKAAHRLVKVRRCDWPYMCCRADTMSQRVWVNRVGTFGISSAPYWWSKLFSLVGRLVGHLMMTAWFLHVVYVDDLHGSFTGRAKFENLWIWIQKAAEKRYVVVTRDFAEFLGRLGFVAQLLTWLKPHLSPLFSWPAVTPSSTVAKLPDAVILTLQYLLAEFSVETFTVSAKRPVTFSGERPRGVWLVTTGQIEKTVGALYDGWHRQSGQRVLLMAVNMQLSAILARSRVGVKLSWRPREENTIADDITNSVFDQVDISKRINIDYSDLPTQISHSLWDTKAQFDAARLVAKAAAAAAPEKKRKRYDKSAW